MEVDCCFDCIFSEREIFLMNEPKKKEVRHPSDLIFPNGDKVGLWSFFLFPFVAFAFNRSG